MNMNKMPTPETDAVWNSPDVCTQFPELAYAMREKSKDLERRLTIAREALMAIADKSVNLEHAERIADRALKLTARNPKP